MNIDFVKMHGLGNDFLVINNTQKTFELTREIIQHLANRHTGVGFDQMIVLESANYVKSSFFYRIYNADGSEVYQCGNGARCVAKYLFDSLLCVGKTLTLETKHASYLVSIELDKITVNMGEPIFISENIPYISKSEPPFIEEQIGEYVFGVCSMGNPHAVLTCTDINKVNVSKIGTLMSENSSFPEGVNVGFMQILSKNEIKLRVYERGVGETLACGSGACAAVVIGLLQNKLANRVTVHLPGGDLEICWNNTNKSGVIMIGKATTVFEGSLLTDYIRGIRLN